jgi:hypothetical protein
MVYRRRVLFWENSSRAVQEEYAELDLSGRLSLICFFRSRVH